ncbi:hypothetical protein FPV67DRAFT_1466612 [Lyophyllum atratum]|nr:hypothetical protein FPV67DRAFT_1466612 [Lyophyllum atratum]
MPKASSRPSFPTSSTDFALPPTSSSPVATSSSVTLDDSNTLLQRFRRPSLLTPKAGYLSESRLHSPLASSFTMHSRRRSQSLMFVEELESDRERMLTDSSSASSENPTPPLKASETKHEELKGKATPSRPPLTPPRKRSSASMDVQDSFSPLPGRRLSFPLKPPRILNLLAESRPEESEVKSEAAFQRLINSCSELPIPPRTPKVTADRGRYPEEAGTEESQREDTPSDDDEQVDDTPFAYSASSGSEPIAIKKPNTPAGSVNGDDLNMSTSESSSFGTIAMDIDLPPGSPSFSSMMSTPINYWRYTPPPTTSAVRSNKRKLEDRFDPYPSASKRRAVSPSMSHLRDAHSGVGSPMNGRNTRLPISIPVNIPGSTVSSATSSPTIGGSYPTSFPRAVSMTASPTLRSAMVLASPILRPVPRYMGRRGEEDEREIQGAGEAVGGLTLE